MDTSVTRKPKTMAELLPGLSGLLSKDAMQAIRLTATKMPRQTMANNRTSEKVLKPMNFAEMRTAIRSLQFQSPKKNVQMTASTKKKWNNSSKLENKAVSHTANGQLKNNSVRKVLNFQAPKPKIPKVQFTNSRMTMINSETPKFLKPEIKAMKTLHLQARNTVRISGICNIPETPVVINKPIKTRMTLANKENISQPNICKKLNATPLLKTTINKQALASQIPETRLSNESWKSSCDASFLQNEQDIEYIESKAKALADEHTLDNIAEVSPPMSTPFTDYRTVKEFFNNSSHLMENTCIDDTIMCFDNVSKENQNREESVIVSLCDMLKKATVSTDKTSTELDDLLEVQKQTEGNLKMIENGIRILNNIKESQLKSLQSVNKLIQEKQSQRISESEKEKTVTAMESPKQHELSLETGISEPCSVIKTTPKSPSYKIPKKYTCMRKKVFHKSMPNIPGPVTPLKDMGEKALSMYLKMKERNNYLNTPAIKQRPMEVPDTPAITSYNLQKQLDKLYHEN